MTDRELLELAAKAAGIEGYWESGVVWYKNPFGDAAGFNPLNSDGDALRLAVRCLPFYTLQYSSEDYEHCSQDGYAATRRAIVRAAAEIGRSMR